MKTPSRTISRPRHIICPACGSGELRPRGPELVTGCPSCGLSVEGAIFKTLEQIATLPDGVGSHACEECGHPGMRRLPDRVYHCPACGSEVLPTEITLDPKRTRVESASTHGMLLLEEGHTRIIGRASGTSLWHHPSRPTQEPPRRR
jgi:ribosomal protein L37AE/L43A